MLNYRPLFLAISSFICSCGAVPVLLYSRESVVRVEFDLRASLNTEAPSSPIELPPRRSVVRVEFDLRESLNALAPESPIVQTSNGVNKYYGYKLRVHNMDYSTKLDNYNIDIPLRSRIVIVIVGASTNSFFDLTASLVSS